MTNKSARSKVPHERTKAGRALLTQKRKVDAWVKDNRKAAPPEIVEAAEILSCELGFAAMNGTHMRRAGLLRAINKLFGTDVLPGGGRG